MSGLELTPPASQADVDAAKANASAALALATTAKSTADSIVADMLTGADRQQAIRTQVTPDSNGKAVFTYPKPYVAGTKPAVTTTAETPDGVTYRNDASVLEGSATNTQVTILVQRIPKTIIASVLGSAISLITPVTTPVWINILIRAPV